ncbi:hypothetical protein BZG21_28235 [Escherichia coli]|nr:hypothetical protein [Escherichia coli]
MLGGQFDDGLHFFGVGRADARPGGAARVQRVGIDIPLGITQGNHVLRAHDFLGCPKKLFTTIHDSPFQWPLAGAAASLS